MKRIIYLLIISTILISFSPFKKEKKLTELQLTFIKEKYKWDMEELLIINFKQPNRNCFWKNNDHPEEGIEWWNKFYSKINLTNISSIFVYSDKVSAKVIIDSKTRFEDYDNFLLTHFFNKKKDCFGVMVINSLGEYELAEGEYTEKEVEKMIKKLKR